jgi:hypothetical protein
LLTLNPETCPSKSGPFPNVRQLSKFAGRFAQASCAGRVSPLLLLSQPRPFRATAEKVSRSDKVFHIPMQNEEVGKPVGKCR